MILVSPSSPPDRLHYVDIAKGIGILLVVIWHYGPDDWWPDFFTAAAAVVYKFHMPLFMFLSGYLFTWDAAQADRFVAAYGKHLKKKGLRLAVPYFGVGLVYLVLKLAGQGFFAWHPVNWQTLANAFINPLGGPATILWFIYCLMLVFVCFPVVQWAVRNDVLIVVLSTGLCFVPAPPLLLLDRFCSFFPLFVYGYMARKHRVLEKVDPRAGFAAVLGVFVAACVWDRAPFLEAGPAVALVGALSGVLACVLGAMLLERAGAASRHLALLGRHSAGIYLMHQPFAWLVAVVVYQRLGITDPAYLWGLPLALALGLAIPIAIETWLLSRSNLLSMAILGVKLKTARVRGTALRLSHPTV